MLEKIDNRVSTLQIANGTLNVGAPFEHSSDCCQISPKRNSDDSNHFTDFGPICAGLQTNIFFVMVRSSYMYWELGTTLGAHRTIRLQLGIV